MRTIVQNPALSERLGVSPIECLDYRLAASLVEAIGDECVRAALKTIELKGVRLAGDLAKLFMTLHTHCFNAHEDALTAFLDGDISLAERVRSARSKVEKTYADIEEIARAQPLDVVAQILTNASFSRQIYEHGVDIADLAVPKRP